MKPIRDYSDGQWLLLLWAFIVIFLITGLAISTPVLVIAILAAIAAGYTTYLYLREASGRSPTGSPFDSLGRAFGTRSRRVDRTGPSDGIAPQETENHEGGAP